MPPTPRAVPRPLPPQALLQGLAGQTGVRVLDALGPEGWGSAPGRASPLRSLLALEPEIEFRGGMAALRDALAWLAPGSGGGPLERILIGHLAYELGRAFEPAVRQPDRRGRSAEVPDVCLGGYRAVYSYDPASGRGEIHGSDAAAMRGLEDGLRQAIPGGAPPRPSPPKRLPLETSDSRFRQGVRTVQDWIRAGDVYQVNLSRRLEFAPAAPALARRLYAELAARAPAPFAAYLDGGDHVVVSNSPERFLRTKGERVETCPIKGTRPRGRSPEEDRWLAKELLASAKDRAEHVMIVDLERNDLGRVCETNSVRVERLAALRSYPTVHHLVSSVQGRLRDPGDLTALLGATFPGGSITGAPKIRAMEIIESLERGPRGVYTGAIGVIDAAGDVDLSIAIRTAVVRGERLSLHVGGGIVADSDAEAELQETRDKASAFVRLWAEEG